MFGGAQTLLNDWQNCRQIAANECGCVKPQSRKDDAAQKAVRGRRQSFEPSLLEHEPIHLTFEYPVNDIFSDTIATIGVELVVQIIAGAARSDLGDKIGSALNIAVIVDLNLVTALRLDEEEAVGLGALSRSRRTVLESPASSPCVPASKWPSQPTRCACCLP
jgi:hypothetical protein